MFKNNQCWLWEVLGNYQATSCEIFKAVGQPTLKISYCIHPLHTSLLFPSLNSTKLFFDRNKNKVHNEVQRPTAFAMGRVAQHVRYFSLQLSQHSSSVTLMFFHKLGGFSKNLLQMHLRHLFYLKPNPENHFIKCKTTKRFPGVPWECLDAYPPLTHGVHSQG